MLTPDSREEILEDDGGIVNIRLDTDLKYGRMEFWKNYGALPTYLHHRCM